MRHFTPKTEHLSTIALGPGMGDGIPDAMPVIERQIDLRKEEEMGGRLHDIPMIKSAKHVIGKNSKYWYNFALPAKLLLDLHPEDSYELISRSKGKNRSRLFVYGPDIAIFTTTSFYRALKQVFNVILLWSTSPSPVPSPTPNPSDFNLIPSPRSGDCKPSLIVRPDGPCQDIEGYIEDYLPTIKARYIENPRGYLYWLPLQHESNLPSDDDFMHAWEIDDCFSDILERAKQHAENCLEKHQGKMNYNIIVQLKQRTIDAGFLQHKSFTAFKRKIQKLNDRWEHVHGVHLSIEIV